MIVYPINRLKGISSYINFRRKDFFMAPMIKPMPACADLSTKSILNKKKFPRFVPEMFSDPVPKDKSKFLLSVSGHKIKKEREKYGIQKFTQ